MVFIHFHLLLGSVWVLLEVYFSESFLEISIVYELQAHDLIDMFVVF